MGLGYLFQLSANNSKGTTILYEPDLNIIWTAFTLVDFSNEILRKNVYITNDFNLVADIIHAKSNIKNTPQILSLPSQRNSNEIEFNNMVKRLQDLVGSFSLDLKYTKEKFYPALKMLINNIPEIINEIPLAKFKDSFIGKTAVIVSAGPTLDKNIETLKKQRNKMSRHGVSGYFC